MVTCVSFFQIAVVFSTLLEAGPGIGGGYVVDWPGIVWGNIALTRDVDESGSHNSEQ